MCIIEILYISFIHSKTLEKTGSGFDTQEKLDLEVNNWLLNRPCNTLF